MELEAINFQEHSAEEFRGKRVTINGIDYEIGEYLGQGGFKIAFKLINAKSRVCDHVIKVYLNLSPEMRQRGKEENEMIGRIKGIKDVGAIVPHGFFYESNGGFYTVQDYIGPYNTEESPHEDAIVAATSVIKKNPSDAVRRLEELRVITPCHTVLLTNLGAAYDQSGDLEKSLECARLAVQIEPHFAQYSYNLIRAYDRLGYYTLARVEYSRLRSLFPYPHSIDRVMLNVLLSSGEPEEAGRILEQNQDADFDKNQVAELIRSHMEEKRKASEIAAPAIKLLEAERTTEALGLLRQAHTLYPWDYELAANYAFVLRDTGAYQASISLLMSRLNSIMEPQLHYACYASIIYTGLKDEKYPQFLPMLRPFYEALVQRNMGNPDISPWDIPAMTVFSFERGNRLIEEAYRDLISTLNKARPYADAGQLPYLNFFIGKFEEAKAAHESSRASSNS